MPIHSAFDPMGRRAFTIGTPALGGREFYLYEGIDRIAAVDSSVEFPNGGAPKLSFLFDGVDHPLRVATSLLESQTSPPPPASPSTITTRVTPAVLAYYELDLAGNVRRLRARDGTDLGGYRYSAFGQILENTAVRGVTPNTVVGAPDQPLRWKGMWRFDVNGTELYDARARIWAPELGTFLGLDEYAFHDDTSTLWGWPGQSPIRWRDPLGRSRAPGNPNAFFDFLAGTASTTRDATVWWASQTASEFSSGNYGDAAASAAVTYATGLAAANLSYLTGALPHAETAVGMAISGGSRCKGAPRGGNNPATRAAAARGSTLHSDRPGHLPDQLRGRYPNTQFAFTKPGIPGQDVKVVGGTHPSEYAGSNWPQGVDHGDFKPGTASGERTFNHDQANKWAEPTVMLPYDPATGLLK